MNKPITKADMRDALKRAGYIDIRYSGNDGGFYATAGPGMEFPDRPGREAATTIVGTFVKLRVLKRKDHAEIVTFYEPTETFNKYGTFTGYAEGVIV